MPNANLLFFVFKCYCKCDNFNSLKPRLLITVYVGLALFLDPDEGINYSGGLTIYKEFTRAFYWLQYQALFA